MKCSTTCNNCELHTDEFITIGMLKYIEVDIPEEVHKYKDTQNEDTDFDSNTLSPTRPTYLVKLSLETCSEVYFVEYLAKKCLAKFVCTDCQSNLLNPNTDLTHIQNI